MPRPKSTAQKKPYTRQKKTTAADAAATAAAAAVVNRAEKVAKSLKNAGNVLSVRQGRPPRAVDMKDGLGNAYELLHPLSEELHSFPDNDFTVPTVKTRWQGSAQISGVSQFVAITATGMQAHDTIATPSVYVHDGTTDKSILPSHPFRLNTSVFETGRRCSCVLEIIYQGALDQAAGALQIISGVNSAAYDNGLDLDTGAEIVNFSNFAMEQPACVTVPVSSLVSRGGKLFVYPRPISANAKDFEQGIKGESTTGIWNGSNQVLAPAWEPIAVVGTALGSSSFIIKFHEIVEVKVGFGSAYKGMETPYINPLPKSMRNPYDSSSVQYAKAIAKVAAPDYKGDAGSAWGVITSYADLAAKQAVRVATTLATKSAIGRLSQEMANQYNNVVALNNMYI